MCKYVSCIITLLILSHGLFLSAQDFEGLFDESRATRIIAGPDMSIYAEPLTRLGSEHILLQLPGEIETHVFNRDGIYRHSIGQRGKGPGELESRRDARVGDDGTVYIYDAVQQKAHAYDSQARHLKDVPLPGAQAGLMLLDGQRILALGSGFYRDKEYLGHIYDLEGRKTGAFNPLTPANKPVNYAWAGTVNADHHIIMADICARDIQVYSAKGTLLKSFPIRSPLVQFFEPPKTEPKSMVELKALLKRFREEQHTQVKDLFYHDHVIFSLFERHGFPNDKARFFLVMFSENGKPLGKGFDIPFPLVNVQQGRFTFQDYQEATDAQPAVLTLHEYRIRGRYIEGI